MSENYQGDYYGWLTSTAAALEQGRFDQVDRVQVAEELRDMGKSERRGIVSQMRVIMVHLLKIQHQPAKRTRSWDITILNARGEIAKLFTESPSLAGRSHELMVDAYDSARLWAADETGLPFEAFPLECPFVVADVMEPRAA